MNFSIPFGSSQDAINAVVQRGVDAMFDIQATGGVADVAFVFEEEEGEEGEEEGRALEMNEEPPRPSRDEKKKNDNDNDNDNTQSEKNNDSTIMTMDEWVSDVKEEFIVVCSACGEDQCLFVQNQASLVAYDEAEHLLGDGEDVPTNNIRRKQLYRQLTLMLNGGPLGAGVRRELPTCCVAGIRQMLPSETFMGFKTE